MRHSTINDCKMNFDGPSNRQIEISHCTFEGLDLCIECLEDIVMRDTTIIAVGELGINATPGTITITPTDGGGALTITETSIKADDDKNLARMFGLWIVNMLSRNNRQWMQFSIGDKPILEITDLKITAHIEIDEPTKQFLEKVESVVRLAVLK